MQSLTMASEAAGAVIRLDPDLEHRNPEIWDPLVNVHEMRERLGAVDTGVVWDVMKIMLPKVDAAVFWLGCRDKWSSSTITSSL